MDFSLGQFIKDKRESSGKRQEDLAKIMGNCTPQFVSNIECGRAPFPVEYVNQVSYFLGVTPKKMFDLMAAEYRKELVEKAKKHNMSKSIA